MQKERVRNKRFITYVIAVFTTSIYKKHNDLTVVGGYRVV